MQNIEAKQGQSLKPGRRAWSKVACRPEVRVIECRGACISVSPPRSPETFAMMIINNFATDQ